MNGTIKRSKALLLMACLGVSFLFLVACATQTPSPTPNSLEAGGGQPAPQAEIGAPSGALPGMVDSGYMNRTGVTYMPAINSGDTNNAGITVSGQGMASGVPDLATLNLGVEAFRDTVQAARDDAASAMDDVVKVLKGRGIEDRDIQTSSFNISPRYDRNGQSITGYQVNNQLTVRIRDLDAVGSIIDDVTAAGGNLTRFQGISFSIENTKPLEKAAREAAVKDLMDKANQLATLAGVNLGKPISINESGGLTPLQVTYFDRAGMAEAAAAPTPIMAGELDVIVSLQAVFAIQ